MCSICNFITESEAFLEGGKGFLKTGAAIGINRLAALVTSFIEQGFYFLRMLVNHRWDFLLLAGAEEQAECEERARKESVHGEDDKRVGRGWQGRGGLPGRGACGCEFPVRASPLGE